MKITVVATSISAEIIKRLESLGFKLTIRFEIGEIMKAFLFLILLAGGMVGCASDTSQHDDNGRFIQELNGVWHSTAESTCSESYTLRFTTSPSVVVSCGDGSQQEVLYWKADGATGVLEIKNNCLNTTMHYSDGKIYSTSLSNQCNVVFER